MDTSYDPYEKDIAEYEDISDAPLESTPIPSPQPSIGNDYWEDDGAKYTTRTKAARNDEHTNWSITIQGNNQEELIQRKDRFLAFIRQHPHALEYHCSDLDTGRETLSRDHFHIFIKFDRSVRAATFGEFYTGIHCCPVEAYFDTTDTVTDAIRKFISYIKRKGPAYAVWNHPNHRKTGEKGEKVYLTKRGLEENTQRVY